MATIEVVFNSLTGSLAGEELDAAAFAGLSDDELEATHKSIARHVAEANKHAALSAAEIARRSDRSLGSSGLAWRKGHLNPEAMVQSLSGGSRVDSRRLVAVGTMMAEAEAAAQLEKQAAEHPEWELPDVAIEMPWHAPLGDAVTAGRIGLDTAGSLRKGLGEPAAGVTREMLRDALAALIESCAGLGDPVIAASQGLNAEQAFTAARRARDRIDTAGIAARAAAMRAAQYFRAWRKPNGMVHGDFDLNPENGTFLLEVLGQITGPRRGGPRFVDAERQARAQKIIDDPRSTNQIHAETIIDLLHIAITADPGTVFSGARPTARVIVQRNSIDARPETGDIDGAIEDPGGIEGHDEVQGHGDGEGHGAFEGHGAIEGHPDPIPLTDIDRHLCDGFTAIAFDGGQVVDVGRGNRFFSQGQKLALAVRDGGCLWPGCEKPPSWTEAHHIDEWVAKKGLTNIADGVLLCKADHLRLHNEGWTIKREGAATYWLIPPPAIDPAQTPIRLASKSTLHLGSPVTIPAAQDPADPTEVRGPAMADVGGRT